VEHLDHQDTVLLQIIKRLEAQREEMLERLNRLGPEMAKQLGTDIVEISNEMAEPSNDIAGNS
jgi:1,2-phenylacetyl-CoA epoxidase catalytic subunit